MTARSTGSTIARVVAKRRRAEQRGDAEQLLHHDPGRPPRDGRTAGEKHVARMAQAAAAPVDPMTPNSAA